MSNEIKNRKAILQKLGIEQLNPMQEEALLAIHNCPEVVLLSPTGSGKTLAFLLPVFAEMDRSIQEVQSIILVPSRELAIQIESVAREMGTGFKVNTAYGGRPFSKEKTSFQHPPALLIGTPGRVGDHIRRRSFSTEQLTHLVLDEFDKSLEIGFEEQMRDILQALPKPKKKILTSATQSIRIPDFVRLQNAVYVNYLDESLEQLRIKRVVSPEKDKLESLVNLLSYLGHDQGIIFCNFKDAIQRVSDFLWQHKISHGIFHGGLDQKERERSLLKFRNGTYRIIVATDLAARGIDVPEIGFIIHYHLPVRESDFIHRNGRTARMNKGGTAYVLHWENDRLPDFIQAYEVEAIEARKTSAPIQWQTLFVSGGRKDKISKGDIAGLFFKKGELEKDELGKIELKEECAFVAVPKNKSRQLIDRLNNQRLKKRKVQVKLI